MRLNLNEDDLKNLVNCYLAMGGRMSIMNTDARQTTNEETTMINSVTCDETGFTVKIGDSIILDDCGYRTATIVDIDQNSSVVNIDTSETPLLTAEDSDGEQWPCTINNISN